jgi:hypothetical protein
VRRYIIGVVITAVLVGSLFRAADDTGVRLMRMFGTLGILLIGIIGTLALTRLQSRQGLKAIEAALKSLEPDSLITDWAYQGKGRPDYLVVGPGGVVAICLEEMAQSTWKGRAAHRVARARERAQASTRWVMERLHKGAHTLPGPISDLLPQVAVRPLVVLTRRKTLAEYTADDVPVLNPEEAGEHVRSLMQLGVLDHSARVELTRVLRVN